MLGKKFIGFWCHIYLTVELSLSVAWKVVSSAAVWSSDALWSPLTARRLLGHLKQLDGQMFSPVCGVPGHRRPAAPQPRTSRRFTGFCGNMADVPQLVKIGISLKMLPNNTAVYFKSDGARFGQTRTIKLLTGSKYKIEVVVKPGAVEAT